MKVEVDNCVVSDEGAIELETLINNSVAFEVVIDAANVEREWANVEFSATRDDSLVDSVRFDPIVDKLVKVDAAPGEVSDSLEAAVEDGINSEAFVLVLEARVLLRTLSSS